MTIAVAPESADLPVADLVAAARVQLHEAIAAGRLPARPHAETLGRIADIVADVGRRAG